MKTIAARISALALSVAVLAGCSVSDATGTASSPIAAATTVVDESFWREAEATEINLNDADGG